MNMQSANASMKELGARVKREWSEITDDDIRFLEANQDEFVAKVQRKQGIAREQVKKRLNELRNELKKAA